MARGGGLSDQIHPLDVRPASRRVWFVFSDSGKLTNSL